MSNYLPFCEICGFPIDQETGRCTNPDCPGAMASICNDEQTDTVTETQA